MSNELYPFQMDMPESNKPTVADRHRKLADELLDSLLKNYQGREAKSFRHAFRRHAETFLISWLADFERQVEKRVREEIARALDAKLKSAG